MKQYFLIISGTYTAKNKLHKAIEAYIWKYNQILVPDTLFNGLSNQIKLDIDNFNRFYPRCKPFKVNVWQPPKLTGDPQEWIISVPDVFSIHFYIVKN